MPNATRTILLLVVLAVGGLWALGYTAQRYARLLHTSAETAEDATRRVEGFVRVRRAMLREIVTWEDGSVDAEALRRARDRALALHRIDPRAYAEIRELYRAWREGRLQAGTSVAAALERRREEVWALHLGSHEPLDS